MAFSIYIFLQNSSISDSHKEFANKTFVTFSKTFQTDKKNI